MIKKVELTDKLVTNNYNNFNNRRTSNTINFGAKNDIFINKTIMAGQTNFINKLKLLFKNKQNIENAKRAGITLEEYEKNLELICPKSIRKRADFIPVGCFYDNNNTKAIEKEINAMVSRIEFFKTKKINVFNNDDENQIRIMINKIKDKISKNEKIMNEELEELGYFWRENVLYPFC